MEGMQTSFDDEIVSFSRPRKDTGTDVIHVRIGSIGRTAEQILGTIEGTLEEQALKRCTQRRDSSF